MKMDMDPITPEEKDMINQLRKAASDLHLKGDFDTDIYYVKWIRARDWDLQRAEEMLRKSMVWRKENGIDNIHNWECPIESIPVDFPLTICGFNKVGSPVAIIPFTYWDVRKGVESGYTAEMIRYIDQCFEIMEIEIRKRSTEEHPVTQLDLIFDMNNLSFWQLASMKTIETILEVVRRYEANHPEILHKAFVINASRMFYMLFNIVKPFLSQRTLAKVSIFSTQPNAWSSALLTNSDADQLPVYFGGTGTGTINAMKMYLENEKRQKWTTINFSPDEKVLLTYDIEIANSKLKWEFKTDHFPIEFSVYKEGLEKEPEVPKTRCCSWIIADEGEITCKTPGQYIAEFSNQYSQYHRENTLHYRLQIVKPK